MADVVVAKDALELLPQCLLGLDGIRRILSLEKPSFIDAHSAYAILIREVWPEDGVVLIHGHQQLHLSYWGAIGSLSHKPVLRLRCSHHLWARPEDTGAAVTNLASHSIQSSLVVLQLAFSLGMDLFIVLVLHLLLDFILHLVLGSLDMVSTNLIGTRGYDASGEWCVLLVAVDVYEALLSVSVVKVVSDMSLC